MSRKILIVDDVSTNRLVLKVKLSSAHYDVLSASSGEEALRLCQKEQPDLVLMDVVMPGMSGVDTCREIKATPAISDIPVILFTALDDHDTRLSGLRAGADDFLAKPIDDVALLARVRSLLRSRDQIRELRLREATCAELGYAENAEPAHVAGEIVLVSPSPENSFRWRQKLSSVVDHKIRIQNSADALSATNYQVSPDLFVLAIDLDQHNEGLRLMAELRCRDVTRHAAFIIMLPTGDSERAATALDLGAWDICYDPFIPGEIAMRIKAQLARKSRADRLRDTLDDTLRLALVDPLTGLYNRRYGLHHLRRIARDCQTHGQSAAVIMVDIDRFKEVNDSHGHQVGDKVLAAIANMMRHRIRRQDLVCRVGGEEFLIVLPDACLKQARKVAERLRQGACEVTLTTRENDLLTVTLSLGIADLGSFAFDVDRALMAVDDALYDAKNKGRNRVSVMD